MPEFPDTIEGIDAEIAQIEGQISTGMQDGTAPDYSSFFKSPGYEFRYDEGIRALDRSAASKGMLMSGGMMRELERYGQGLATSEFGNYANRLASLAGIGQTSAFQSGQIGSVAAGQVGQSSNALGQSILTGAEAQASGTVGAANAWQTGINDAAGALAGIDWGRVF
jgi:hypothetical protein